MGLRHSPTAFAAQCKHAHASRVEYGTSNSAFFNIAFIHRRRAGGQCSSKGHHTAIGKFNYNGEHTHNIRNCTATYPGLQPKQFIHLRTERPSHGHGETATDSISLYINGVLQSIQSSGLIVLPLSGYASGIYNVNAIDTSSGLWTYIPLIISSSEVGGGDNPPRPRLPHQ